MVSCQGSVKCSWKGGQVIIFWVLLAWLVMEFLFSYGRTIREFYEEELER